MDRAFKVSLLWNDLAPACFDGKPEKARRITFTQRIEGVIFEVDQERVENRLRDAGAAKAFDGFQSIVTFDFEDTALIRDNVILRIRRTGTEVDVQMKKLSAKENPNYRQEHEITAQFADVDEAKEFLLEKGLVVTGHQERRIIRYVLGELRFNVVVWPQTPPYVGIEGNNQPEIEHGAHIIGYQSHDLISTTGEEIFEKYNLDLESCTFDELPTD